MPEGVRGQSSLKTAAPPEPEAMQPALEAVLHKADMQAERVGSIVRMSVALSLLLTIWFSVDGFALAVPDIVYQIELARATLGLLFLSGLVGYVLIRLGLWRPWLAYVTVTVDVLVTVANVSFSLSQYEIASDFFFAFPVAMTFSLVLAVSALRFRPAVQVYALVILVLGIVVTFLLIPGLSFVQRGGIVGRLGFVFGPPPNAIRIVMLALTGIVLIILTARVRAMLREAIRDSMRSAALSLFVSDGVARAVDRFRLEELKKGARLFVAVMFVDIRGSTALGERTSPEIFAALIGRYRAIICEVVAAHGGVVDKFMGDGAMIVFGGIEPGGDDAARALACALALDRRLAATLREDDEPIPIGIGVHHGEVFAGLIGDDSRLEFTVMGDTVNVASRLEQETRGLAHRLLASGEALAAAKADPAAWRLLSSKPLRGRDGEVAIHVPAYDQIQA